MDGNNGKYPLRFKCLPEKAKLKSTVENSADGETEIQSEKCEKNIKHF